MPVLGVPKSLFKVQGETRSYAVLGASGKKSIRHFCPTCGSLLFGTPEVAPDTVTICVGTLDDPSVFRAEAIIFKRSRHSWD
ncbi:MAG: GFA family protein, partial [Candidatus Binataceae bacterium]